eukprot:4074299-Alexandrium_andersonii.AAC.1
MPIQMSKCIRMPTSSRERKGFRAQVRRGEEATFTQMQNAMRDLGANLNMTKGPDSAIRKTRFAAASKAARALASLHVPIEVAAR